MRQQAHKWANAKEQVAGPMHFRRSSASFRQQNWAAVFVLLLVQTARIARAPLAESRSCGADGLWSRDLGGLCSPGRVFGAADRCDKWTHSGGRAEGCSSSASGGASERRAAGSIPAGASHSAGIQLVSADHAANGASARGGQQKDGVSHGCSLRLQRRALLAHIHPYLPAPAMLQGLRPGLRADGAASAGHDTVPLWHVAGCELARGPTAGRRCSWPATLGPAAALAPDAGRLCSITLFI